MNDLYKQPVFSFLHEDIAGVVTTKTFEAESWVKALESFVYFLKGVGFVIEANSIQIHENHDGSDDWTGMYCNGGGEVEPDWSQTVMTADQLIDSLGSLMRNSQGVGY